MPPFSYSIYLRNVKGILVEKKFVYSDTTKSGFPAVSGCEVEGHAARKVLHKEAL